MPGFGIGMINDDFHIAGIRQVVAEKLKRVVMYSIALGLRCFKWKMLSLSGPKALLFLQLLIAFITRSVVNVRTISNGFLLVSIVTTLVSYSVEGNSFILCFAFCSAINSFNSSQQLGQVCLLVVVYPLPWPLLVGGVRCSRLWSTSQLLRPSGQQCSHSGGVCPQIQGRQFGAYVGAVEEMMCVVCVDVTEGA